MLDDNNLYDFNTDDDTCDLDANKICDNCGKCIEDLHEDYKIVRIDGIVKDENLELNLDEYLLEDETLSDDEENTTDSLLEVEYIEDIPQLKQEYDEKIDKLLGRE